jgi:hypothetical protein
MCTGEWALILPIINADGIIQGVFQEQWDLDE